ncbi:VOC family protein [Brassicibacter mesophilus]|uniref:VOC family protein n=1 Tax=Brassicibacter mesophilus TaxID=745119 RepID=UPI003D1A7E48
MIVTPNFHFRGNCKDAIELYKEVFNIDILCMFKNKDANPIDYVSDNKYSGRVYHAEVMLGNTRLIMSDISEENEHIPGNSLSLVVTFDTANEVKKAYSLLKNDAIILAPMQSTTYSSCFISLIDKFGMRWELMTEQTER